VKAIDVLTVAAGTLGVVVTVFGAVLRRLPLSGPLAALATGATLGPLTGWVGLPPLDRWLDDLHLATRAVLGLSVMAVGLRYPFSQVRRHARRTLLLLSVGVPGMAAVGAAATWLVLGLGLGGSILLGSALSPTDPVLAASVVTGAEARRSVPRASRQLLSLESGANDGLALPVVLIAAAMAGTIGPGHAVAGALWQVVVAVVVGAATGLAGGCALRRAVGREDAEPPDVPLLPVPLGLLTLGLAGLAHADGVLAAFVAGLCVNAVIDDRLRSRLSPPTEAVTALLVLPLFLAVGAGLPWRGWVALGWRGPVLVVAVLLVRRLPILLALRRPLRLTVPDALYLGWFGPIGVSALFYLTFEGQRLNAVTEPMLAAGTLVVTGSTVVHSVTAAPLRHWYQRRNGAAGKAAAR
jgi:NhaP-type Na+/H+ or K+/H+ antiporter